jgi:manganese efflux pump family protein
VLQTLRKPALTAAAGAAHPAHPVYLAHAGSLGRLLVSGFALSLDNLAAGFALGTLHVGIVTGALVIGSVSVALSLAGLEIGGRIGAAAGRRSEQIGGAILVAVGLAIAAGAI